MLDKKGGETEWAEELWALEEQLFEVGAGDNMLWVVCSSFV